MENRTIRFRGLINCFNFYGKQNNTTPSPKFIFMGGRTLQRRPFRRHRPLTVLHPSSGPSSLFCFLHPPPVRCPSRRRRPLSFLRPSVARPFFVVSLRSSIVRPVFVVVVFCSSVARPVVVVVVLCPSAAGAGQLTATQRFVSVMTSACGDWRPIDIFVHAHIV